MSGFVATRDDSSSQGPPNPTGGGRALPPAVPENSLPTVSGVTSSTRGAPLPHQRQSPFVGRQGTGAHVARRGSHGNWKTHTRSASYTGILRSGTDSALAKDQGHAPSLPNSSTPTPPYVKGHHRAYSHGQMNEGRGHRREGSRTDFILPEGHEQRERQRTSRSKKASVKRSSLQRRGHSREVSRTESVYTIRNQKRSLLQRFLFWKKNLNESCSRLVVPNHMVPSDVTSSTHPNSEYPRNQICTTKYTLLSFLPKNLFEQFHRFANLYFLFIVLLNFVPSVNAFAKELAVTPLLFVLGVTAVKDAFEDHRRHRSDARVNGRTCRVYSSLQGRYVKVTWSNIRVGDVVHLSCDETIPADVVLLNAANDHGVCYIESSNLDGETNLKQRQTVRGIGMDDSFEVSKFDNVVEVGPPSTKINYFVGSIPVTSGERIPLTKDNLILRDCVIKNTDFVEGIVVYAGRETKAQLNNGGTRYKRSKLERLMNRDVIWCVVILVLISLFSATGSALWKLSYMESLSFGEVVPFLPPSTLTENLKLSVVVDQSPVWIAFTNFWTFIILYQVLIPISLYVTIEVIKMMQVYHIHHDRHFKDKETNTTINCRALNISEELGQVEYVFTDKTGTLTENNMVFQRCSINGVDYDHSPLRVSPKQACQSVSRDTFVLNPQLQEELNSVELQYIYAQPGSRQACSRSGISQRKDSQRILDFFFTLAACNTVVVAKHPRKDQMNASGMMIASEVNSTVSDEKGGASNSPRYSLAMKNPLLRSIFYSSRSLSPIASSPFSTPLPSPDSSPRQNSAHFSLMRLSPFSHSKVPHSPDITLSTFETLPESNTSALADDGCNRKPRPTVLPLEGSTANPYLQPSRSPSPSVPLYSLKPIYEAESPDELALVDAAFKYGCRLLQRNLHSVLVSLPGSGVSEFEVLNVLPFDSNRKRMSIIVKDPETGEKILYCKGADSAILENLSKRTNEACQLRLLQTQQHLNVYSKKGLRVLCMAKRALSDTEYEDWALSHKQAENSLASREQKLVESYGRIETNLQLTGVTGVEDRLQDGVPETVKALREAGINVWVLTGDKQETAINIAYSCSLFSPNMEIIKLNASTKDQTERTIRAYLQQIEEREEITGEAEQRPTSNDVNLGSFLSPSSREMDGTTRTTPERATTRERGLVIDGKTLVYILDHRTNLKMTFLTLANHCDAVMCCRVNPLQKALIVRTAKDKLKVLTLAVGDGANDVSMIQTADVGVGISGVEGRQAVMSSDFAITRFRHLQKLLLVHGHWCYDRLARIILYFYYKNACFVFLLMWFQLYCGYSTAVMIDDLYLVVFNLLFTSFPPLAVGIYDRDAPQELLLSQPPLYAKTRLSTVYTPGSFWINILDAFYQSAVIFFVVAISYDHTDAGLYEFGMTVTHCCVLTQLLHISIETKSWTVIHLLGVLGSYFVYFAFGVLYTVVCNGCIGLPSQYGELGHMVITPKHWFCVGVTCITTLLPRFVTRALQATIWPDSVTQAVREKVINEGYYMEKTSTMSTASSSYRQKNEEESCADDDDDASDTVSSLVTMTTIQSTNDETDV